MEMGDYEKNQSFLNLRTTVATRTRRIIIWCGAGLSAPAGIPTWNALQRRLENALAEKLQTIEISETQRTHKLRSIKLETNPWIAFHRLQNELGMTSFRETVRSALSKASSAELPPAYNSLWKLKPYGVITLNIDRLAARAGTEAGIPGIIEFKGKELGSYSYTLNTPRSFVCNMHGIEEDVDSWVFTQPELRNLADTPAYQQYISAVLMSSTVIFVGITADDVAVGGHLERLISTGIRPQTHYWITDKRDQATDQWAERNNIIAIRYKPTAADHPELISILDHLASYVQPEDGAQPPVALELNLSAPTIPSVSELSREDPEKIRSKLNSHASFLLKKNDTESFEKFEKFSKDYDRAVHAAWYISTAQGENEFLGYKLSEEIAKGAFGTVYRAYDGTGEPYAIKVLHAEIRKERELLNAFRRGVRSMKILGEKEIDGMVKYRAASEFPATLVMDWVDGPNLNEAVESGSLSDWESIVDISLQLSQIISTAHALPERVLHRDVRPSNMIVEGFWTGDKPHLVVLDFDLSWHRGSFEKSVIFGSQLSGYLAPEQIQARKGVSTQHASVDSYGIGMTLFFMASRRNPKPGEHAYSGWKSTVKELCGKVAGSPWRSLAQRVARLIVAATQDRQEQRWDVSQIRSELHQLKNALSDPTNVKSAELLAEELAVRSQMLKDYTWDDSRYMAEVDFRTGLKVSLSGDESSHQVVFGLSRIANEAADRNRMGDMLTRARDAIRMTLREAGWDFDGDIGQGSLSVSARIDCSVVASSMEQTAESVKKAIERSILQ